MSVKSGIPSASDPEIIDQGEPGLPTDVPHEPEPVVQICMPF